MAEGRGPYLNRAFKYRRPRSTRGQFGTRKKEPPQCHLTPHPRRLQWRPSSRRRRGRTTATSPHWGPCGRGRPATPGPTSRRGAEGARAKGRTTFLLLRQGSATVQCVASGGGAGPGGGGRRRRRRRDATQQVVRRSILPGRCGSCAAADCVRCVGL
jgi:hypothetical protein